MENKDTRVEKMEKKKKLILIVLSYVSKQIDGLICFSMKDSQQAGLLIW